MIFRVAINAPLHGLFDYLPPADWSGDSDLVGRRVEVTFGRGKTTGLIAGIAPDSSLPGSRLRKITRILDQKPVLEPDMLDLLLWAASYYQHPAGEVIAAALPLGLRQGRPLGGLETVWSLTSTGEQQDPDILARRAPRQWELWRRLKQAPGGVSETALSDLPQGWRNTLKRMQDKGWISSREEQPGKRQELSINPGPELTADQARAAALVTGAEGFSPFLLFGVTGSGKTEVYFEAMEQVLAAGRQVLFLVPEIGLTPQLLERVRNRFDGNLAILHSGLSDGERLASWRDAASGAAHIIIGTRSAALVPMARPGMIIVDEEHDPSYKQWEGFRYSARDMAVARARRHGVSIVLGSATPSLESLYNVRKGRYAQLDLPERPGTVNHPDIRLVDLRAHACDEGVSTPLVLAAEKHLAEGGQVLFFLNRRGYAPTLFCPGCGWTARCKRCDAGMVVHQRQQLLRCHHCDTQRRIPETCEDCHETLAPVGQGTERVEETLSRLLPGYPQVRIDRDSTQRKGAMEDLLGKIRSGQARILTGTQMLTKGHDFPDVSLVAVLNADQGLFGTDFRASERLAQTIVQVAGRAGRAERPGLVLIQTLYPEHPLLTRLVNDGYAAFAQACLAEREASGWPPFSHLALLRAESAGMQQTLAFLQQARELLDLPADNSIGVLGPAPAPMEKRAGRYRGQLLLEARERPMLQRLLTDWLGKVRELPHARKVRWSIDVDPIELF